MKTKIKVRVLTSGCEPQITEKGDWVDVKSAEDFTFYPPTISNGPNLIGCGIAVKLPKGYEMIMAARSSSYKNYGFILSNAIGVVDNSYCGDNDELKVSMISMMTTNIRKGDRIAQFRIQLSQKATFWQKLKWLFSSGIKLEFVEHLSDKDRGGFGSTGKQ